MIGKEDSNAKFVRLEEDVQEIVDRGYKDIIEDLNRTLNGIVQSTLLNAEYTKKSVSVAMSDIKGRLFSKERNDFGSLLDKQMSKSFTFIENFGKSGVKSESREVEDWKGEKKIKPASIRPITPLQRVKRPVKQETPKKSQSSSIKLRNFSKLLEKPENISEASNDADYSMNHDESSNGGMEEDPVDNNETNTKNNDAHNNEELTDNSIADENNFQEGTFIDPNGFQCNQCSYIAQKDRNLRVHVKAMHVNSEVLSCDLCPYTTTRLRNMRQHINGIHSHNEKLICKECGAKFTQRGSLSSHVKNIHYNIKNHKCNECGQAFHKRSNLDKHVQRKH